MVLSGYFYQDFRRHRAHIYEENYRRLTLMSEVVKNGLVTLMLEGKGRQFKDFIATIVAEDMEAVRLVNVDGRVLSSSVFQEKGSTVAAPPLKPRLVRDSHLMPLSIFVPIYNSRPCRRCHASEPEILTVLQVELSPEYAGRELRDARRSAILNVIVGFAGLFLPLVLIMKRFVSKPLGHIAADLKRVAGGDFAVRFRTEGADEIREISKGLNEALEKIESVKKRLEDCHRDAMSRMEKMASLGELAAAVAHEIKNPLAGISGAIQVLAEDIPQADPRREIIKEILGEIDRLDQSVRNLLTYARPPELRLVEVDLQPVIERAVRILGRQAANQAVDIRMSASEGLPPVQVDPEQMQQVFLNLMLNALHSMPGGGVLSIDTRPDPQGRGVEVAFSDTGMGISREAIKDIFKPFFTTKHSGTGLGLAISKNIVEKHGGFLEAQSQPGLGSVFRVIIPYRAAGEENVQG